MGYRSQVCIAINKDLFNEKADATLKKSLEDCDDILLSENKETFYFIYQYVKWYDGYEEVDRVNSFIRENLDKTCLLRIGEDDADIERIGDYFNFDVYIVKNFDIPKHSKVNHKDFFSGNAIKFIKDSEE